MKQLLTILTFAVGFIHHSHGQTDSLKSDSIREALEDVKFDIRKYSTMFRQHSITIESDFGIDPDYTMVQFNIDAETTFHNYKNGKWLVDAGLGFIRYTEPGLSAISELAIKTGIRYVYSNWRIKPEVAIENQMIVTKYTSKPLLIEAEPISDNFRVLINGGYIGFRYEPPNGRLRLKVGALFVPWVPNYPNAFTQLGVSYGI